ncbi:hypothetical protein [Streptomyces roseus]|nr:hypothetical protein [Streptomyces roseus]
MELGIIGLLPRSAVPYLGLLPLVLITIGLLILVEGGAFGL